MDQLFDPKFNDQDRIAFLKISLKTLDIDEKEIIKINEKLKWFKEYLEKDRAIYWEEYSRFVGKFKISDSLKDYSPDKEMFEIRDEKNRQILPPNLIVDENFKIDGTIHKCV